ncbi:MAG: hypothetical protein H7Z73_04770 [Candidatus Saccharibacteria bacterium]|nr:hypothetical protein [Moraxellaceae bacterium]
MSLWNKMQIYKQHTLLQGLRYSTLILLALSLTGCVVHQKQSKYIDAVEAPFHDLNLIQKGIPSLLVEAEIAPYLVPSDQSCEALSKNIYELDVALGTDQKGHMIDPTMYKRAVEELDEQAVDAIRNTTESLLPFRGWVRKVSGAARHSKRIARANAAGLIRRSFLKGVRVSKNCPMVLPQQPFGPTALNFAPLGRPNGRT